MRLNVTLLLFAPLLITAQPVLDASNSAPLPGQSFLVHQGTFFTPPSGGADQVWDMSTLDILGSATVDLVDPAGSVHASSYPSATVLETTSGNSQLRYFTSAPDGLKLLGYSVPSQGFVLPFAPPTLVRPYPCTFGDTWTHDLGGFTNFQGFDIFLTGTHQGEADGYGTLIMPWGTVQNVLRVRNLSTETQVFVGAGQSTNQQETWDLLVAGAPFPLVRFAERREQQTGGGFSVTSQSLLWLADLNTAVNDALRTDTGLQLYPNPAYGTVNLIVRGPAERVDLIDAMGRTVRTTSLSNIGSDTVVPIGIQGLPAGLYSVRASHQDGRISTTPLVVE